MFKDLLQQARGAKALNGIRYSYRLTLKNAARHRHCQSRVSQMPDLHEQLIPNSELLSRGRSRSHTHCSAAQPTGLGFGRDSRYESNAETPNCRRFEKAPRDHTPNG
jgi:hypothetical protein